ncbi:hypothetical protein F4V43_01795 [Paenibacillus spiritus]|uniref:Uncharacterized protein n=1 Tax=Paenibacillus spiritus TaxID=2496557 RepID=A0A5J5GIB0_9BACL|nr:hypothetical protein [Paenibacillus spiritus]KAA9007244.1 hypothetical protein F4V43_01795 [Paenibacillus spiritus]
MTKPYENRSHQQVWDEEWKDICTKEDGTLNLDQIQRVLYDYSFMLDQVPRVYEEVSGLSKPNAYASAIIAEYEIRVNERFNWYVDEILNILLSMYDANAKDEPDYSDGIMAAITEIKEYAGIE